MITTQNTGVNVHAAHCAALVLRGIPRVIIIYNSASFSNFGSKFVQTLFLILHHLKNYYFHDAKLELLR